MTRKLRRKAESPPGAESNNAVQVNQEPELEHSEINPEIFDENNFSLGADIDPDLQDYLIRQNLIDSDYYVMLYKFNPDNPKEKEFTDRYDHEIPSEYQIGVKHGAGRYMFILQCSDRNGKRRGTTKTFKLGPYFDELKKERLEKEMIERNSRMIAGMPIQNNSGRDTMQDTLKLLAGVIGLLSPLIAPRLQQQQALPQMPQMGEIMAENFKAINEVMKNMYLDQTQFYNDINRERQGLSEVVETEKESTGLVNMLSMLKPLVEMYLPVIVGKGPKSATTVRRIKQMPQFQEVIKNRETIKGLIDFIKQNHGDDKAQIVMKKFGIK